MPQDEHRINQLVHWINTREEVRHKREAGEPKPWTSDPILQWYHFCNVHREDDRGTKEIHAVRKKCSVPTMHMPTFYTAARLFNKPESLEVYWKKGIDGVKAMREKGEKVFHVAYVVSTCGASMDKLDYVQRVVVDVAERDIRNGSCRMAFDDLRMVPGLGSFLSGQVVADLKYTPYLDLTPDWDDFAVMGPGSKKGLDLIFGGGTTERNFMSRLIVLRQNIQHLVPAMHNQDLQNCLCEFSKYIRYLDETPGRRRTYNAVR